MIPEAPLECQSIPQIGTPQIGRNGGKDQYSKVGAVIRRHRSSAEKGIEQKGHIAELKVLPGGTGPGAP
jgi:hypothetical protein